MTATHHQSTACKSPPSCTVHRRPSAARHRRGAAAFWKGFDAIVADLAPKNIALLAERDRLQTELDTWHKANPGPITPTCLRLPRVSGKDRLPGARAQEGQDHHHQRGCRAGHAGRPAAGGADPERPLRPERRQRALGQPVRRAVRHRRDLPKTRAAKRSATRAATTPSAAPRSSNTRATCWTAPRR